MKSKRFKKKNILSVLSGLPSAMFDSIADSIDKKGHDKATFGVSIATLGTFSLLILGVFYDITNASGVVITNQMIRTFFIIAFSLILSGLLKIIEAFSIRKTPRLLAFSSNFLLLVGLTAFIVNIVSLLYGTFLIL